MNLSRIFACLMAISLVPTVCAQTSPPQPGYFLGLGVYRPSTQHAYLYADLSSKTFDTNGAFGNIGDIPLVGDFDGNGVWDLAVYRAGNWLMDTHHDFTVGQSTAFGGDPVDVPLAADFDADGIADLIIYRSGTWYIRSSKTAAVSQKSLGGLPGDQPVVADFDGDAIPDLAIYRGGTWLIQLSTGSSIVDHFGGAPGGRACAADWNHDGRADLCIYRNGIWRFRSLGSPGLIGTYALGGPGDIPLAGGAFDYAESIYVSAAASGIQNGSAAHPFASVSQAFAAATTVSGSVIRMAGGNYTDNLVLAGPTHPGGKNGLKILGVNRRAVKWTPASGDAVTLYGSVGNLIESVTISSPASGGRGITLIGGPGSVVPSDPGATIVIRFSAITDTDSYGILISGTSDATIEYNAISKSRTKSGIGAQGGAPTATISHNDIFMNGYTLTSGLDGNGIEAAASSNMTITGNTIHDNNRFGIIGVTDAHLAIGNNAIIANELDGIILCGSGGNDTSTAQIIGNDISGNGLNHVLLGGQGFNGVEFYITCTGTQTVSNNTISGNSLDGIFVGAGTLNAVGNMISNNKIGITVYAENASSANTVVDVFGNQFMNNSQDGVFTDLTPGTTRTISGTIGGSQVGQANTFIGQGFHGISCNSNTIALTCPSGGNVFFSNADNIESTCPATCSQ